MIGKTLGHYQITNQLGKGGMGEVFQAKDQKLGRDVAIKVLSDEFARDPDRVARFQREAKVLASLNHPNIAAIYGLEESGGTSFLVLELVDGETLSERMKRGSIPVEESLNLAQQIATALGAAHKKGIIHRDLKPGNIMVTDEGSVKLLDFGLAKPCERNAHGSDMQTIDFPATQAGAILGTIAYMSPEQAQGQPADARSDIFSFGLVLYEMLSGKRAFSGDNFLAILVALQRVEPPPLQASPSLEKIVRRCLAKQPSVRFQKMSEVKTALEQVFGEKMSGSPAEPQPSIAVLPFVNMSGDKEQEYFSDGLAEEIINALTQIPRLKVIARTSAFAFKGKQTDVRKIAELLGVANILEGSVRKAGNRIRVTAQLITAADGSHLWSQRYDRDLTDVFAIQDEIAAAIVDALQVKLSVEPAARRRHEPNLAAHEAYLKARYHWGKLRPESLELCKEYFEEAIALDPEFALAHCGYADYFLFMASSLLPAHEVMPLMREEARRALALDPLLPEAHALLGIVAGVYDYDWKEAERLFRLAMAHDPVPPRVRQWYGVMFLLPMGRTEEAVEQAEQGLKGDPLNIAARIGLVASLFSLGRLSDAQAEFYKALEFEENNEWAFLFLALTYARQEKWTEALHFAEEANLMTPMAIGTLAGVLKRMGEVDRAEDLTQKLMPGEAYGAPLGLCYFYLLCGEIERATDWLEKAIEQRQPNVGIYMLLHSRFTSRWSALARLMNLPEEAL